MFVATSLSKAFTDVSKVERLDWTKAVVAIWVVFAPESAVGAVGVPVNAGLAFVA